MGFTLTFSALYVKLSKVQRVFRHSQELKYVKVSLVSLLRTIALILIVDVAVLLVWNIKSPLKYVRTILNEDTFGNPIESTGSCTPPEGESVFKFAAPVAMIHFLLLVHASYIAYSCRHIDGAFQEFKASISKFIFYRLY